MSITSRPSEQLGIINPERHPVDAASAGTVRESFQRRLARGLRRWLSRTWFLWLVGVLLSLIIVRVILPYGMVLGINRALSQPGAFHGHVNDISLSLWRGAYAVHQLQVVAPSNHGEDPALEFSAEGIDIAIDWHQAWHGRIRSAIKVYQPKLIIRHLSPDISPVPLPGQPLTKDAAAQKDGDPHPDADKIGTELEDTNKRKSEEQWQDRVAMVIPFNVNTLHIDRGIVQYVDDKRSFNLQLSDVHGLISNISGGRGNAVTPTTFKLVALTTGGGLLKTEGTVEPLALTPTFDIKASIDGVHLVELNESAKHLKGLTFTHGVFSANTEMTSANGEITGYVKPLFINLGVSFFGDDKDSAATKIFWRLAGVVAENILPNDDTNALAARIPIVGRYDQPHTDTWTIISSALSNAFLSPILPGYEPIGQFFSKK